MEQREDLDPVSTVSSVEFCRGCQDFTPHRTIRTCTRRASVTGHDPLVSPAELENCSRTAFTRTWNLPVGLISGGEAGGGGHPPGVFEPPAAPTSLLASRPPQRSDADPPLPPSLP